MSNTLVLQHSSDPIVCSILSMQNFATFQVFRYPYRSKDSKAALHTPDMVALMMYKAGVRLAERSRCKTDGK